MMPKGQIPLISCMQKIVIYETKARYFVVGSNNTETRFRVLKIDRTEPKDLNITDDGVEYTQKEIRDLLLMIDVGNRPKVQQKAGAGLLKTVSAFGIVGYVRFLEGYYIVLITKRRKVALIGPHTIYKIEDTSMVYIPNETVRFSHPDEQRYVKIFQNVDLSSNFYFSYSYDLTHTLQYNMTPCKGLGDETVPEPTSPKSSKNNKSDKSKTQKSAHHSSGDIVYGTRTKPSQKYVWNSHMLKGLQDQIHSDWILSIIHGFIGQHNICVYGRPVYLTLIARRSKQFAGTRFLKRGANNRGEVANEVETEQIVHDASVLSLHSGRYTAFVQHRGSLPLSWSQDISKMVPKPPITLDQRDPFGLLAGQHFNSMLERYGSPIIILNLVKKREKKRHESILSEEFVKVLQYLNQFLPPKHAIRYIGFDMARVSKRSDKNSNVLHRLAEIAEYCVKTTGIFHSGTGLHCNKIRPHPRWRGIAQMSGNNGHMQRGVVRTNCVDCLDRTNTSQFAMGKCALALQLYALGILDSPCLEFDTDCVRMLEELYEDQGDTLALQYGGSQLVHRIKGYRKLSPWTSSSRDIMQTLSRYYSNAFSDAEKQNALNLFLGIFEPVDGAMNLWELGTDFYLHNSLQAPYSWLAPPLSYSQWWSPSVIKALPASPEEEYKGEDGLVEIVMADRKDERVDAFWDYYRPYEFTSLDEIYSFQIPNSIKDFMPKFSTAYSPFATRVQPGRRQEESGMIDINPNISGKDSTASISSTGSEEGSTSSSDGSDIEGDLDVLTDHEIMHEDSGLSAVSLKDLFPSMAQMYGVEIEEPFKHDTALYKRYVQIGSTATHPVEDRTNVKTFKKTTDLIQKSTFSLDSSYSVEPPKVNSKSKDIYAKYIECGKEGAKIPSKRNNKLYHDYFRKKYL